MKDNGDGQTTSSKKIDWTAILIQVFLELLILGGALFAYIVANERWKGAVEANIANFQTTNRAQLETNLRLQIAIDKIGDTLNTVANTQAGVTKLLEYHMGEHARSFQKLQPPKDR